MSRGTWSAWRKPLERIRRVDHYNVRERRMEKRDAYSWAPWLLDLEHESGVYAFRDAESGATIYIGHSHTGRLYSTITRHWQRWSSTTNKRFDPEWCECRVIVCSDAEAPLLEAAAIQIAKDAGEPLYNEQDGRSYMPDSDEDEPF